MHGGSLECVGVWAGSRGPEVDVRPESADGCGGQGWEWMFTLSSKHNVAGCYLAVEYKWLRLISNYHNLLEAQRINFGAQHVASDRKGLPLKRKQKNQHRGIARVVVQDTTWSLTSRFPSRHHLKTDFALCSRLFRVHFIGIQKSEFPRVPGWVNHLKRGISAWKLGGTLTTASSRVHDPISLLCVLTLCTWYSLLSTLPVFCVIKLVVCTSTCSFFL